MRSKFDNAPLEFISKMKFWNTSLQIKQWIKGKEDHAGLIKTKEND